MLFYFSGSEERIVDWGSEIVDRSYIRGERSGEGGGGVYCEEHLFSSNPKCI